jgi:colanic acid/amylovoran biosynthesis protein
MIIEIRGVGSHNKGAEMMLLTILQELNNESIKFSVMPKRNRCEYDFYSRLGIYPKVWFKYKVFNLNYLGKFIPKKIRKLYGLVLDDEIDVILDASGFSYSDQWGERPAKLMAESIRRWKKNRKSIIFMPQSFGPFKNQKIRNYMKEIIEKSDLIYARDDFSLWSLTDIIKNASNIKKSPDFTILFNGITPEYFDKRYQICVIPNIRMIDKRHDSKDYFLVLIRIIEYLQKKALTPFFLIHGQEDISLVNEINNRLKIKIPIINEMDPRFIKGIIKECKGVIGSRFHALASALYYGVSTIGIGWSHKYRYLFEDFNFGEGLIEPTITDEKLYEILDNFLDEKEMKKRNKKFLLVAQTIKQQAILMFEEIKKFLAI